MKTSEALKKTLEQLWDGESNHTYKQYFICHAANVCGMDDIVKPIIISLLNGAFTLEKWIENSGLVDNFTYMKNHLNETLEFRSMMQATRKAWLENLIQEYELIGD